jgi:NAD(P)H-hydrate epimerase
VDLLVRLADLALPVVAVDGPTGLDLLSGVQHGPLRADLTVTFGGYRRGHLLARDEVGDVVVCDIGFPPADPLWPQLFTDAGALALLEALPARSHKGERGRVVVVGGDVGLTGAARLAARAAFAAGAGLVHVAAPADAVATLGTAEPDIQARIQPLDGPLTAEVGTLIEQAGAVVIGPGLNRTPGRKAFVLEAGARARVVVLDADALTALQGDVPAIRRLTEGRTVILTPHLGEFRTLFPEHATEAAVDPWTAAAAAATASGAIVLLKGVPTVIASPGGAIWTVAAGNPGLATGGSGDTLSGLIATFLAQRMAPLEAAALAAQTLGRAADLAASRRSARGLRPMDVIDAVPDLWRGWKVAAAAVPSIRPPILHELERPQAS